MGANVRYNGVVKAQLHPILKKWQQEGRLVTVCPEVSGGLSTPRPAAEIQISTASSSKRLSKKVVTQAGDDVSEAFERGAYHALRLCQAHQINYALLKEFSPSCGGSQVYDGTFSAHKVPGQGVTASLLSHHGIKMYSELTLEQLISDIESTI